MKKNFVPFFLLQILVAEAAFTIEAGVALGVGGGVSVGIINSPTPSDSSPSSTSNLNNAYTALQAWKTAINDDPLGILKTWVGSNVCTYKGVFCFQNYETEDSQTSLVVAAIDLNHANLQGKLVKELCLLTDLSLLHLNTNRFYGTIPNTFNNLLSLTELDLSNNLFSGLFPTTILQIPNLLYLDLRFNNFTGKIPDQVFNKKLDAILLNNNQFTGEIPQNLGNSPASVINLANNKLTGEIPFSISYSSPQLKEVLFLNNQLTGCVPDGVGLWSELEVLDISFNSITGKLPDSISCLHEIEVLNLGYNKISGELPKLVCSLKTLVNLTVAHNFLSGFSDECDKLFDGNSGFDFSSNCIPGRGMQRPKAECSGIPAGGLSCMRIPGPKAIVCGTLFEGQEKISNNSSSLVTPP